MDVVIDSSIDVVPNDGLLIPSQHHYYHQILTCLGYPADQPPVADLLRQLDHLTGKWLVISPIHWQATHNDAMIMAVGEELQLQETEAQAWFNALAEFLKPTQLHYYNSHTWLMQCNDQPPIFAKPAHTLRHQSMMPHLEFLDDSLFWQRFITECQMFLSGHSLNKQRSFPLNGLWIWGGGELQLPGKRPIVVDEQQNKQLATCLSTNVNIYSPQQHFTDDTLILWRDVERITELQQHLKQQAVSWYWNNQAYSSKPASWFKRLWSHIK